MCIYGKVIKFVSVILCIYHINGFHIAEGFLFFFLALFFMAFCMLLPGCFQAPKAIRGGVLICFFQVRTHGTLERYGFAKNWLWSVDHDPQQMATSSSKRAYLMFLLFDTKFLFFSLCLRYTIMLMSIQFNLIMCI